MFKSLFRRSNQLKSIPQKCLFNKNVSILSSLNRNFSSAEQANPPTASFKSVHTESLHSLGLDYLGATKDSICYRNLPYGEIQDHAIRNREALLTSCGALAVDTGKFTGRSPLDKFIVKQEPSDKNIWWGDINQSMTPETFDILYDRVIKHYQNESERVYVLDAYCGAHESSRRSVRFVTEKAWHQHFVKNMFIRIEDQEELSDFSPDFTVINAYGLVANDWKKLGLHSEVFVAFNVEKKIAIIGGAWYGGEMKKGIFSMMHYWLPQENCLSMHCSANIGQKNDVCLFFGLSGTGKTTLSTDPERRLIGDDEHGWDNEGIFNFEGGCYAKTSKLSLDTEPEIYRAVKFNSLMENVWISPYTHDIDYFNLSITENGRVSYPIEHIENREDSLAGGHPEYIIFLCCDAFGVLPPIAKLNAGQSMYHFISGYTAKVAGTERGIKEPQATFSPCYGAAFLTLHPMEYARLMKKKLENHNVDCYLVNTGWSGGAYGEGERMSIKTTRNCINAIFNGAIKKSRFREDTLFKFQVPENIPGVDSQLLNPRNTWKDKKAFDRAAIDLANRFAENISQYTDDISEYQGCGPIGQVKAN